MLGEHRADVGVVVLHADRRHAQARGERAGDAGGVEVGVEVVGDRARRSGREREQGLGGRLDLAARIGVVEVAEVGAKPRAAVLEQAAGITCGQEVYDFIMAGSEAAGAASGIMNAADPIAMIDEMIAATRRAADDLKKDVKSGSYNPLVYRFHAEGGTLTAEDRAALAATLNSSVQTMAAAFELADFGPWRAIIESVVYEGLYAVGAAVLNGTFRKGRRRKQRKAGA